MSRIKEKIHRLILKIDYSTKIKFIIFSVIFAAFWLEFLQLKIHNAFIDSLKQEIKGLEVFEQVTEVQSAILDYVIALEKNPQGILQEVQAKAVSDSIHQLDHILQTMELTPNLQSLTEKLALFSHAWQKKQSLVEEETMMLEHMQDLLLITCDTYRTQLNFDQAIYLLFRLLYVEVPCIRSNIVSLGNIGVKDLPTWQEKFYQNEISTGLNRIEAFLKESLKINENLQRTWTDADAQVFNHFYSLVKSLLSVPSSKSDPHLSIQILEEGVLVEKTLIHLIRPILNEQLQGLLLRRLLTTLYVVSGPFFVLALYMTRVIRRPLADLKEGAERLSMGNLSTRVPVFNRDEVGNIAIAFNEMVSFFEAVMLDAEKVASHLSESSQTIFDTAKQLETNVIDQERSIRSIVFNTKGIIHTIQDFSKFLSQVQVNAKNTTLLITQGQKNIMEMEQLVQQMGTASNQIVQTLLDLETHVHKVNRVINAMVKIVDQITLLALNSTIRAGKKEFSHHGFSVISQKIQELANQTAFATLDIEEIVKRVSDAVTITVDQVVNFSAQIKDVLLEATDIKDQLKHLIDETQGLVNSFEEINQQMAEQSIRAELINDSTEQLIAGAHKTTTSVRSLYVEIEYLHHAVNNLQAMTKQFTTHSKKINDLEHNLPISESV